MNTSDVFTALQQKYSNNQKTIDSNGQEMIELHNILFTCDKDYIIPNVKGESEFDLSWYEEWYEPIIYNYRYGNQFEEVVKKLIESPTTRQGTLIMGSQYEHVVPGYICTISMQVYIESNNLHYTVIMRSNEAVRFESDIKWHNTVYNKLINEIESRTGIRYNKEPIEWFACSFHVLSDHFKYLEK